MRTERPGRIIFLLPQATQRRFTPSSTTLWPADCWCPHLTTSQSDCGTWTVERRSKSSVDTRTRWVTEINTAIKSWKTRLNKSNATYRLFGQQFGYILVCLAFLFFSLFSLCPCLGYIQIFGMAWSPDGKLLATVCKDGKVCIYDPRKSAEPVQVCKLMNKCNHFQSLNKTLHTHTLFSFLLPGGPRSRGPQRSSCGVGV